MHMHKVAWLTSNFRIQPDLRSLRTPKEGESDYRSAATYQGNGKHSEADGEVTEEVMTLSNHTRLHQLAKSFWWKSEQDFRPENYVPGQKGKYCDAHNRARTLLVHLSHGATWQGFQMEHGWANAPKE
jgi:hypothetical protein